MRFLRRSDFAFLSLAACAIVFGVLLNPLMTTTLEREQTALGIVALVALAAVALEIFRSLTNSTGVACPSALRGHVESTNMPAQLGHATPSNRLGVLIGLAAVLFAWAVLYSVRWTKPKLFADDYRYMMAAADKETGKFTWRATRQILFEPFNEHLVVGARLATFAVLKASPGDMPMQTSFALFSGAAFIVTCLLAFVLFRRVGLGDLGGLIGVACFAVSICHSEIVMWYSASQWLVPTSLLIGSLLFVERDSQSRLFLASLFAALGPWNYTLGAIVGPFTTLWLLGWHRRLRWGSLIPAVVGIASTIVVLVIVRQSMSGGRYWDSGGRGMIEAFSPWMGLVYSARLFVDRLILTNLGYRGLPVSMTTASIVIGTLAVVMIWTLRTKPTFARLWPTAALIVIGYAIAIPFRTWQPYESLVDWNRYQLLPHLGMSLLMAGIIGCLPNARGAISWRSTVSFVFLVACWAFIQHAARWK